MVGCQIPSRDLVWRTYANSGRYENIWLPTSHSKVFSLKCHSRLRLLLHTLQAKPGLGVLVKNINLTKEHQTSLEREDVAKCVALIIRCCPELQKLNGFTHRHPSRAPTDLILTALSTKNGLREAVLHLTGNGAGGEPKSNFYQIHQRWSKLETLVILDTPGYPFLEPGSLYSLLRHLPALQHLALAKLGPKSFHDGNLSALGRLKSLRLESLSGVKDYGLEQLFSPTTIVSLESLALIEMDIKSLRTISALLSNFRNLKRFTLLQAMPPGLPLGAEVTSARGLPLMHSASLTYLHWETLDIGSATRALAQSICTGGFPRLRKVRVPCDSDGSIQAVCRPLAYRSLTASEIRACERVERQEKEEAEYAGGSLARARVAAQLRLRTSRRVPAVNIVVQDEQGVRNVHVIGQYLGDIRSRVRYCLEPDFARTDHAVGRLDDLMEYQDGGGDCEQHGKKRSSSSSSRVRKRLQREVQSLF